LKKSSPDNFGGLPPKYSNYKNSSIVILPVPFDKTSTWVKGSSKGPHAIINASKNLELYDIDTGYEIYTKGIHTAGKISGLTPEVMANKVYKKTMELLGDDKFTVVLGGEHTVSLGSIKAHTGHFDNLSILHLDAHSDMRDTYEGNKYSHACVMARANELSDKIVSVGIRSMDSSELKNINTSCPLQAPRNQEDWAGMKLLICWIMFQRKKTSLVLMLLNSARLTMLLLIFLPQNSYTNF